MQPNLVNMTAMIRDFSAYGFLRSTGVDDSLEPSRFLAELFESIAEFAFRILGQLNHVRSVLPAVRAI
jgi:hypothetical protein